MDFQSNAADLELYIAKLLREVVGTEKGKHQSLISVLSSDVASCKSKIEKDVIEFWTSKENAMSVLKKYEDLNKKLMHSVEKVDKYCDDVLSPTFERLNDASLMMKTKITFISSYLPFSEVITKLKDIHSLIEKAVQLQAQNMCYNAVVTLNKATEEHKILVKLLEGLIAESTLSVDVYKLSSTMKDNMDALRQNFVHVFVTKWNKNVTWRFSSANNEDRVTLCFSECFRNKMEPCKDLIRALEELGVLEKVLKELWGNILDRVVLPLMNDSRVCALVENEELVLVHKKSEVKSNFLNVPLILDQLQVVLTYFSNTFSSIENDSIFYYICDSEQDLMELIIEKGVLPSMPTNQSDLTNFNKILDSVAEFEVWLVEKGFIKSKSVTLMKLTSNLEVQFVSKVSQIYLLKARDLIKRGLYPLVEIDPDRFETKIEVPVQVKFPRCKVSESVIILSELVEEVFKECQNFSGIQLERFTEAIADICELYVNIAFIIHGKAVEDIPQQTSVFYNNCMFLSQRLTLVVKALEEKYMNDAETAVHRMTEAIAEIKQLGFSSFRTQIEKQRSIVSDFLQSTTKTASRLVSDTDFPMMSFEKNIKRSLFHLSELYKLWFGVLPESVSFKSIGTLYNSFLEEIISLVVALEDISADVADRFAELFELINGQIDNVLGSAPVSLEILLPKWFAFQELKILLQGSLQDIVDRWSDGHGPLAIAFDAQEVKRLIRALFQNTERRATALSRIR